MTILLLALGGMIACLFIGFLTMAAILDDLPPGDVDIIVRCKTPCQSGGEVSE